jgi:hypothetical protein
VSNPNVRPAIIAAAVAMVVAALFAIATIPPERTCEEWGHTPVRIEDEWTCIPWEQVVNLEDSVGG